MDVFIAVRLSGMPKGETRHRNVDIYPVLKLKGPERIFRFRNFPFPPPGMKPDEFEVPPCETLYSEGEAISAWLHYANNLERVGSYEKSAYDQALVGAYVIRRSYELGLIEGAMYLDIWEQAKNGS